MDLIKTVTTVVRAGSTVERVGKMNESGVSDATIAQQMTDNSRNGIVYSTADVRALCRVYKDCKTAVLVTKKQANSLMDEQELCASGAQPA